MVVTAKQCVQRAFETLETVEHHTDNSELIKALSGAADSYVFLARLILEFESEFAD